MKALNHNKYQRMPPQKVVDLGYETLVQNLGLVGAVQFLMSAFPGQGDSVEYYRKFRQGKNVDDVVKEIKQAKLEGVI